MSKEINTDDGLHSDPSLSQAVETALLCIWPGCRNLATHREIYRGKAWGQREPEQVFCPVHTKLRRRQCGGSQWLRKLRLPKIATE